MIDKKEKGDTHMLHLLISRDWVAVRNEILNRVALDVSAERGGRILIVPELISHDMERRLCAVAGDTASRFAEILTFTGLARRVAEQVGSAAMECMDDGGRMVAMASAARSLYSQLKVYASVETKPEFLTQVLEAVDEFKRCCITSQDLKEASEKADGILAQKLEELSLLYAAYDGLCSRGKRDPRDQMTWLLEQLEDGSFGECHTFYIDGFPDYTRQHMAILEHLIRVSPHVTVGLNCDRADSSALAFEKAGATAAELIQMAKRLNVPVRVESVPEREDPMLHAWCALFQGELPVLPADGRLTALRTESAFSEVCTAAARILQLVRGGCRFRDIGIVCADMEAYRHLIELQFDRSGIPVYQSGKEDILQKTAVATVLSSLDAALGGFEQKDVLRYLKSCLSPLDPDTSDRVENYAVLWGIRGNHWLQPWSNHPDGLGELWTEEAEHCLSELNGARQIALQPLQNLREKFLAASDLEGQVLALYGFLEEICLAQRLQELADSMDASGDNRTSQVLNQLWEILLSALEQMYGVLGKTVWEPESFIRLFTLLLSQYDVGTIPPVLDAVTVGPASAMRCQQVKHLLILGAAEGALPGYGGSEGLLNDQERTALRKLGLTLTGGAMDGILAEFADIYGVFCGASDTVTVFCPEEQPSYVYRRFAQMAGGQEFVKPSGWKAVTNPQDAAAYLAGLGAENTAEELGLSDAYRNARERIGFDLGNVSAEHIKGLYGRRLNLSASQIDRQAECRMSYFLKYGLRARERKEAAVDPAEFGTYVHAVLENTAKEVMLRGGFQKVSLERTMEIALKYSEEYASQRFSQMDSSRITYLFRRNRRELEMVVTELWQELKASRFIPSYFELSFGEGKTMDAITIPSGSMEAVLRGFVDRVDIWKDGGCTYFRVVDYKTGKKDFDYCDVFNGVGLQMLLYLFALEEMGHEIIGQYPAAAGVQYFPARAPLISADSALGQKEAELLRRKEWKRRGLLLEDENVLQAMEPGGDFSRLCVSRKKDGTIAGDLANAQQLKMLRRFIFSLLGDMVDDIASGNVRPNPYTRGNSHDACAFCPYGSVCRKIYMEGRRNYKAMTSQRFWEEIGKGEKHHG